MVECRNANISNCIDTYISQTLAYACRAEAGTNFIGTFTKKILQNFLCFYYLKFPEILQMLYELVYVVSSDGNV